MSHPTLLIVDDEPHVIKALTRALIEDHLNITSARNAADGLQVMANQHVDIVISDYKMPGLTGIQFLQHVRFLYPDVVTCLLTAHADMDMVINAINTAGVFKFFKKPWKDWELRTALAQAKRICVLSGKNPANGQTGSLMPELETRIGKPDMERNPPISIDVQKDVREPMVGCRAQNFTKTISDDALQQIYDGLKSGEKWQVYKKMEEILYSRHICDLLRIDYVRPDKDMGTVCAFALSQLNLMPEIKVQP